MLHRLMRWTVFSHANRVMSKDINHRKFHDRCETQGTPSVVAEDQKSGAEYSELSECQSVQDRPHRVLANPKMDISRPQRIATNLISTFKGKSGLRRWRKIRRTTDQPWMPLGDCIQYFAGRISAGDSFRVRWECRDCRIPAFRRFTVLNCESLGCQLRKLFLVSGKQIHPITAQFSASLSNFGLEILRHFRWNQELSVFGPAVTSFCRADLIFTERFAMSCARVLFGWRAIRDMAIDDD